MNLTIFDKVFINIKKLKIMTFIVKKYRLFSDEKKLYHEILNDCKNINFQPLIKSAKKGT